MQTPAPLEYEVARRVALAMGRRLHLRQDDIDELVGDAYLATALLVQRWDPERDVPLIVYVGKYVAARTTDLYRARNRGSRTKVGPLREYPTDVIPERALEEPVDVDWILERTNRQEAEVLRRIMAGMSVNDIGHELGVSPSRVSHILRRIRSRF